MKVSKVSRRKTSDVAAPGGAAKPAPEAKTAAVSAGGSPAPADGVVLSDTSQTLATAKAALEAIPEIRVERVSEIRSSVDDGTYRVDSRAVAKRMVDESLRESARLEGGRKR